MTKSSLAPALLLLVAACASIETAPPATQAKPVVDPAPAASARPAALEIVTLPSAKSPLVAVRLLFRAGSAYDPAGKEGLAALTGLMLGEAGTERRSYSELIDTLYPMAASIEVMTDRCSPPASAMTAPVGDLVAHPCLAGGARGRRPSPFVPYRAAAQRRQACARS